MSKILIHSIVFSPDSVSTAYLYNDIALKLKETGNEVVVLTTTPHYNVLDEELAKQPLKPVFGGLYFTSNFRGIVVKHIPQKKYKSSLLRMLGFAYWHIFTFLLALFERKVDVILSPSPPLTIGIVNIILGWFKGARVIYNVQEIYPDLLIENGGIKSNLIIKPLQWLEKFVYRFSDKVTTVDQIFYNTIVERFNDKSKLSIIPNFVDTDLYKPIIKENLLLDSEIFKKDDFLKIMYAGNIGLAQDWIPLLKVAEDFKNKNIRFYVIGEGAMKQHIEEEKKRLELSNLVILPYQARERMPHLIAYADMHFIFMSPETEMHGFPSKVYTILACGKPLLVCSGSETPIFKFLENINCAFLISDNELSVKTAKINNILQNINNDVLLKMGKNGEKIIQEYYSKSIVTQQYNNLINSLKS